MKWFIIVVMTAQLSAGGKDETPLWIPEMVFNSKQECMTFARNNQIRLFSKSASAYDNKILPTMLNCVDQNVMKEFMQLYGKKNNEENI